MILQEPYLIIYFILLYNISIDIDKHFYLIVLFDYSYAKLIGVTQSKISFSKSVRTAFGEHIIAPPYIIAVYITLLSQHVDESNFEFCQIRAGPPVHVQHKLDS